MEVVHIFAHLYAIRYKKGDLDEFEKTFDLWGDPSYLNEFFEANENDLHNGFLGNISIEQAVERTLDNAEALQQELLQLASGDPDTTNKTLDILFRPLTDREHNVVVLSKQKAYGPDKDSWLRLYALKIDPGYYVVTGGAIKLTPTMNERKHTDSELKKLERSRSFLQEEGLLDKEGFNEL
jgi:hypothetical protein